MRLENLRFLQDFDPDRHWIGSSERISLLGEREITLTLEEKPTGLIGWIVRLFYAYVYRPAYLQLETVIPNLNRFVQRVEDLYRGDLQRLESVRRNAERIYQYFMDKCQQRNYSNQIPILRRALDRYADFQLERLQRVRERIYQQREERAQQEPFSGPGVSSSLQLVFRRQAPKVEISALDKKIDKIACRYREGPEARKVFSSPIFAQLESYPFDFEKGKIANAKLNALLCFTDENYGADPQQSQFLLFSSSEHNFFYIRHQMSKVESLLIGEQERKYKTDAINQKILVLLIDHFYQLKEKLSKEKCEEDFRRKFTTFIIELAESFQACNNNLTNGLERLFRANILPPSKQGEEMKHKILKILEKLRIALLDEVISKVLQKAPEAGIRKDHASTLHFYKRDPEIFEMFGVPVPLAFLDHSFSLFARKGLKPQIIEALNREYTVRAMIRYINEHILHQGDILKSQHFQEWAKQNLCGGSSEELHKHYLDDLDMWSPELIARMLERFAIIRSC